MEHTTQVAPEILEAFGLRPQGAATALTSGHINDTFLVEDEGKWILQRINHFVFPSPQDIMENITGVTEFLRAKIAARGGDPDRGTLTIRKTAGGSSLFVDSTGEFWRCMTYVDGASSHETVESAAMLREAGRAFGEFQSLLCDYPADTLHETIVDFHNTPVRFAQLREAAEKNAAGRLSQVEAEMAFAAQREADGSLLMDLLREGKLPLRVTHNDTKMSNVLMDNETGKAVCVIDLDTVMPGLTAFDFGDSIRAGASTAAEDEARLMTLEVGIRFLADYLNGDVYFRTAYPEHNLVRARNQFQLVREMEEKRAGMDAIIQRYL